MSALCALLVAAHKGEGTVGAESKPRRRRSSSRGSVSTINGNPNKWRVKVYVNGKQRSLPGGPWPTKDAAERALTLWNARRLIAESSGHSLDALLHADQIESAPGPHTVAAGSSARQSLGDTPFGEVYLKSLVKKGGLAGMTRDRQTFYRTCVTGEAKTRSGEPIVGRMVLGRLPVGRITVEVIENWAASMLYNENEALRLKPATVAKWGRHLSQALKWAKSAGYITDNPMEHAQVVARGDQSRTRQPKYVFTLDEMWRLTEAISDPCERLMAETLMWSGLRQGELRALTPESLVGRAVPLLQVSHSVNSDQGKAILGPTKTEGSERRVPIPKRLMARLKRHAKGVQPGHPLFPAPTGSDRWMRHEWFNRRFRAWCDAADLTGNPMDPRKGRRQPPTPHGLRATGASILFAAGATVPEVQAFLGHKQPLMTLQVYTEVKGFGDEDRVMLACRGQGLTVPQILDYVYEAVFARGVLGLREERPDDASAFDVESDWDLADDIRPDVTRLVVGIAESDWAERDTRLAVVSGRGADRVPPVRVPARRPVTIETQSSG